MHFSVPDDYIITDIFLLIPQCTKILIILSKKYRNIITKIFLLCNFIHQSNIFVGAIKNANIKLLQYIDSLEINEKYIPWKYPRSTCSCMNDYENKSLQLPRMGIYWRDGIYGKYALKKIKLLM